MQVHVPMAEPVSKLTWFSFRDCLLSSQARDFRGCVSPFPFKLQHVHGLHTATRQQNCDKVPMS